jgi:hypothetical protein
MRLENIAKNMLAYQDHGYSICWGIVQRLDIGISLPGGIFQAAGWYIAAQAMPGR